MSGTFIQVTKSFRAIRVGLQMEFLGAQNTPQAKTRKAGLEVLVGGRGDLSRGMAQKITG